jgi:hypothetical protein
LNGDLGRLIDRTKGGMNTKLDAVADENGRPLSFFMAAGQVRDYTGAAALLDDLHKAPWLLGNRGYGAHFKTPCRPSASSSAYRVGNPATSRSDTISAAAGGTAASRSCSDA